MGPSAQDALKDAWLGGRKGTLSALQVCVWGTRLWLEVGTRIPGPGEGLGQVRPPSGGEGVGTARGLERAGKLYVFWLSLHLLN